MLKNKINKIFVVLLGVFLLVGGTLFAACNRKAPQADISVSSESFKDDKYIEFDMNSENLTAQIVATVKNASKGEVFVNNDHQDKVFVTTDYNSSNGQTVINLTAKEETDEPITLFLTSHANGSTKIQVYAYSDILGLSQYQDEEGEPKTQFVVKGEETPLSSDRFLNFTSRPNGVSNRKDVVWSFEPENENEQQSVHLDAEKGTLLVDDTLDANTETITLTATSVYTEFSTPVTLYVIDPLPKVETRFSSSREPGSWDQLIDDSEFFNFNLVKNDDSNKEAEAYIQLSANVNADVKIQPIVYSNGEVVTDRLDFPIQSDPISPTNRTAVYKIITRSKDLTRENLTVCFRLYYTEFSVEEYSVDTARFGVNLVDVIDKMTVTSGNDTLSTGSEIKLYNHYESDTLMLSGRPFTVELGPSTVDNDNAKFFIRVTLPEGLEIPEGEGDEINRLIVVNKGTIENGVVTFKKVSDNTYESTEYLNNYTTLYLLAAEGFETKDGQQIKFDFISEQSKNVHTEINFTCYRAPTEDFILGTNGDVDIEEFLPTAEVGTTKEISFVSEQLRGIRGITFKEAASSSPNFDVSFSYDWQSGVVNLTVKNIKRDLDNEKISIYLVHENGYKSKNNVVITGFIAMTRASVELTGASAASATSVAYGTQNFANVPNASQDDTTLEYVFMRTGTSLNFLFNSNKADARVKFIEAGSSDSRANENWRTAAGDIEAFIQELKDAQESTKVENLFGLVSVNEDFKGYVFVTFVGLNASHETIEFYRIFYFEAYTTPSSLMPDVERVELLATNSVSAQEGELARAHITIKYRVDSKPITYYGLADLNLTDVRSSFKIYSQNTAILTNEEQNFLEKTGTGYLIQDVNRYYSIDNIAFYPQSLTFDIIAESTDGYSSHTDQLVIEYQVFNRSYHGFVNIQIDNAQRVETVKWRNQTDDEIIYLNLNSNTESEKSFPIITEVRPYNARNNALGYKFVADEGTEFDLVSVSDMGLVTFKQFGNLRPKGGTGYVYVYPKDSVISKRNIENLVYYTDDPEHEGEMIEHDVPLINLSDEYENIIQGYYYTRDGEEINKIYYRDILLKLKVVVADGQSEETAERIYTLSQLENMVLTNHYVLMRSLTLTDWMAYGGSSFYGTLKGYNENITITFAGDSDALFNVIEEGAKVENFTFIGEVADNGMVANENFGTINNVTITIQTNETSTLPSKVSGNGQYVGSVVGENYGLISNAVVEGMTVSSSNGADDAYVGGIAGKNDGRITDSRVEFYLFAEDTASVISGANVGGIVGLLAADGTIERSFAYNYTNLSVLKATKQAGSLIAKAETGASISLSFALIGSADHLADETILSEATLSDVYYSTSVVSGEQTNPSNWVNSGETGFLSYVRGGNAHLKDVYQAPTINDLSGFNIAEHGVEENGYTKALKVSDKVALVFLRELSSSLELAANESAALERINTLSLVSLLRNSQAANIVAFSSNSSVLEVNGSALIIKQTGEITLTLKSKQNFSVSSTITLKIVHAVDDFTASYNSRVNPPYDIKIRLLEGIERSQYVDFAFERSIFLANNSVPFEIEVDPITVKTNVDKLTNYVSFTTNGLTGTITAKTGAADAFEALENKSNLILTAWPEIDGLAAEYNAAIKNKNLSTLQVTPAKGSIHITANFDSITIKPAYTAVVRVDLETDNDEENLTFALKDGTTPVYDENSQIYTFNRLTNLPMLKMTVAKQVNTTLDPSATFDGHIIFELTIWVDDNYKHLIQELEEYTLLIGSESKQADNEGLELGIKLPSQSINYIDIANYRSGMDTYQNGTRIYQRLSTLTSVISPGRTSIMQIVLDPDFAYYDHFTVTYSTSSAYVLGITKLKPNSSAASNVNVTAYVYDANCEAVPGGVLVDYDQAAHGVYVFMLYAGANITSDTQFEVTVEFFNRNNGSLKKQSFMLNVSVLPIAELTIDNGKVRAAVAKGGSVEVEITIQKDQVLGPLAFPKAQDITLSRWTEKSSDDRTRTYVATLYAGLNANVDGHNGEFQLIETVERVFNGIREEKTSYVSVVIVDFLPSASSVEGARYDETLGKEVLQVPNGVRTNFNLTYHFSPDTYSYDVTDADDRATVASLMQKRNQFVSQGYYREPSSGISINYEVGKNGAPDRIIPIYERITVGNSKANFVRSVENVNGQSEEVWTYTGQYFIITYRQSSGLYVKGIVTTPSPINVRVDNAIKLDSMGDDYSYPISTNFAIEVIDYSSDDHPHEIADADDFLGVAQEGQAFDYILTNDIVLNGYRPFSAENFVSLDGNGYTIHIASFATPTSSDVQLALFTNIPEGTIIKNLKVNYYNGGNININLAGDTTITSVQVAGLAITNEGIITNSEVLAYYDDYEGVVVQDGDVGIRVRFKRGDNDYYLSDSSITSEIAGFVITNTGNITNSRVGGTLTRHIISSKYPVSDYEIFELGKFTLLGQGEMAGFVLSNQGHIAASGAGQIQITNESLLPSSNTAGFVRTNSGKIGTSYVEGCEEDTSLNKPTYHLKGSNITSKGYVAGFVIENDTSTDVPGEIYDCYSNILIANDSTVKSFSSAGFVYKNYGVIRTSYTASYVDKADLLQLSFSGVDRNGGSLNSGTIQNSYYFIQDFRDDEADDVQKVIEDGPTLINVSEVNKQQAYYGFVFASSANTDSTIVDTEATYENDGIWKIIENKGVKLVSRDVITLSHRYKSDDENADGTYNFIYTTGLKNAATSAELQGTEYGGINNPILIKSAEDFKKAMGESTSTPVMQKYTSEEVKGFYRFVDDAEFSSLNADLGNGRVGNAVISSITKTLTGGIDGNGFTLQNVSLGLQGLGFGREEEQSLTSVGLFSKIQGSYNGANGGGIVQNLNIEVSNVTFANVPIVGTLAGIVQDGKITNVTVTQTALSSDAQGNQYGVGGSNITGGIIGAVFGDSKLNGLTANNIIVQSGYSSDVNNENNARYLQYFNPTQIRSVSGGDDLFTEDKGIKNYSFAGGIVGYLDSVDSASSQSADMFDYNENLASYTTRMLLVKGSVDIRGEVVGGVAGYTGLKSKIQDMALILSKETDGYENILSLNNFAGGLVGYANGQFYQVYSEHDETLQNNIESQTRAYYQSTSLSSSIAAERGVQDLFAYAQQDTGRVRYNPTHVGGLFGVVGTAAINVAYSKINAINETEKGYAGGIAGGIVTPANKFRVTIPRDQSAKEYSLYLNEVYASGDVFAHTAQGGLFGTMQGSNIKLGLSSVNAVNLYGIAENEYVYDEETSTATLYAIVGVENANKEGAKSLFDSSIDIFPSATAIVGKEEDDKCKTFGYMTDYTLGAVATPQRKINVVPYEGYEGKTNSDIVFKIAAVSNFVDQAAGYTETNGAFVGSGSWDSANWIHDTARLFPTINFVNAVSYLYLDANEDSIVKVLGKMNMSAIEVRVRGQYYDEQNDKITYKDVDLRPYLRSISASGIQQFSGRIVGGSASTDWGDGFGPIAHGNYTTESLYPGVIIGRDSWLQTAATGVKVENLNVFIDTEDYGTDVTGQIYESSDKTITGGFLCETEMANASISSTNFFIGSLVKFKTSSGAAGLIAPKLTSTSVMDVSFYFGSGNGNDNTLNKMLNSGDNQAYISVVASDNANVSFGLIAGSLTQDSKYQTMRVQNINVYHEDVKMSDTAENYLISIENQAATKGTTNLGLYAGIIEPTKKGNTAYAKLAITVQSPKHLNGSDSLITPLRFDGDTANLNFGGYFGSMEPTSGVQIDTEGVNEFHKFTLYAAGKVSELANIGGFAGNSTLTRFSFDERNFKTDIFFRGDASEYKSANVGLLFGQASGDITLDSNIFTGKIINSAKTISSLNMGAIIGSNKATIVMDSNDKTPITLLVGLSESADPGNFEFKGESSFKVGDITLGGLFGRNESSVTVSGTVLFNNVEGKEMTSIEATKITAGDFVGINAGKGELEMGNASFKSFATNKFESTSAVITGGFVGDNSGKITLGEETAQSAQKSAEINSVYYLGGKGVTAGGLIGSNNNSGTTAISNAVFGGAFEFTSANNEEATHIIGGLVGTVDGGSVTLTNNQTYGDAIYTYNDSTVEKSKFTTLKSYTFGGAIANGPENFMTLSGNVIGFTNNNPRVLKDENVDALIGNHVSLTAGSGNNYYTSQLVLAVSQDKTAIDIGYNTPTDLGYGNTASDTGDYFLNMVGGGTGKQGTKLNPILSRVVTDSEANSHDITYFAYSRVSSSSGGSAKGPFAFIGNFSDTSEERLKTEIGVHSFVSGFCPTYDLTDADTNDVGSAIQEGSSSVTIFGGIADKLAGGIIFGSRVSGEISISGTSVYDIGGIVGRMDNGKISQTYSSANITYRAGENGHAASFVGQITNAHNFIDTCYATGDVKSYIAAKLYAMTNVASGYTMIKNSYTISWLNINDYTAQAVSGTRSLFGETALSSTGSTGLDLVNTQYDPNGTEFAEDGKTALTSNSDNTIKFTGDNPTLWDNNADKNYGYPYLNFKAFDQSSYVTIEDSKYYVIFNATKLNQVSQQNEGATSKNGFLHRDINFNNCTIVCQDLNFEKGTFEGDNHIITTGTKLEKTLFNKVNTLNNLKVTVSDQGVSLSAVVATNIKNADNVSAVGYINGNAENMGGLFATSSGTITNCRNYVKVDGGASATNVGGIVGNASDGSISNSLNYAPINATKGGANAGGIAGQSEATISCCGNENTVFAGYTVGDNANYNAGGIVGFAKKNISGSYNTAMVKAGNKNCKIAVYAGGIAGYLDNGARITTFTNAGKNIKCVNEGFIEALSYVDPADMELQYTLTKYGDLYFTKDSSYYIRISDLKTGKADKNYANANEPAGNLTSSFDLAACGQVYRNGMAGEKTLKSDGTCCRFNPNVILDPTTLETNQGLKVTYSEPELHIAETDSLGGPKSFFFTMERTISYSSVIKSSEATEIKQTLYTQPTYLYYENTDRNYHTYQELAYKDNTKYTNDSISTIRRIISDNDFKTPDQSINVNGKIYKFVGDGASFAEAVQLNYSSTTITIDKINGKSIKELSDAGYTFTASASAQEYATSGSALFSSLSYEYDENGDITKLILTVSVPTSGVSKVWYNVSANFPTVNAQISVDASNLILDSTNSKVYIYYTPSSPTEALISGQNFVITYAEGKTAGFISEAMGENETTQRLVYTGTNAKEVFDGLLSEAYSTITLNINQGKKSEETSSFSVTSDSVLEVAERSYQGTASIKQVQQTSWEEGVLEYYTQALRLKSGKQSGGLISTGAPTDSTRITRGEYTTTNDGKDVTFDIKIKGKPTQLDVTSYSNAGIVWTFALTNNTPYLVDYEQTESQKICDFKLNQEYEISGEFWVNSASYDNDITTINVTLKCSEAITTTHHYDTLFVDYYCSLENTFLSGLQVRAKYDYTPEVDLKYYNIGYTYTEDLNEVLELTYKVIARNATMDEKSVVGSGIAQNYSFTGDIISVLQSVKVKDNGFADNTNYTTYAAVNGRKFTFEGGVYSVETITPNGSSISVNGKSYEISFTDGKLKLGDVTSTDGYSITLDGQRYLYEASDNSLTALYKDTDLSFVLSYIAKTTVSSRTIDTDILINDVERDGDTLKEVLTNEKGEPIKDQDGNEQRLVTKVLYEQVLYLQINGESTTKVPGSFNGQVTLVDKTYTISSDGTSLTNGSDEIQLEFGTTNQTTQVTIDYRVWQVDKDSNGLTFTLIGYRGKDGMLVVEGKVLNYIYYGEDSVYIHDTSGAQCQITSKNVTIDGEETQAETTTVGGTEYIVVHETQELTGYDINIQTLTVNNAYLQMVVTLKKDNAQVDFPINTSLRITLVHKTDSSEKNVNIGLINVTGTYASSYDLGKTEFYSYEVYTDNGQISKNYSFDNNTFTFNPSSTATNYSVRISGKSTYQEKDSETVASSGTQEKIKGVVLVNDVILNASNSLQIDGGIAISGNGYSVNFVYSATSSNATSLFHYSGDVSFIKDLNVAGTASDYFGYHSNSSYYRASILFTGTQSGTIDNVKTFGTVSLNPNVGNAITVDGSAVGDIMKLGIVTNETIDASKVTNISNFASFCVGPEQSNNKVKLMGFGAFKSGVGTKSGSTLINLGTIIGADGAAGARGQSNVNGGVGGKGVDGQSVYAISSDTVSSAKNFGIIKAGKGGNGGRGLDGAGGADSDNGTAPGEGTNGATGGNNGEKGTASSPTANDTHIISTEVNTYGVEIEEEGEGTGNYKALDGNNGWDGLDLHKYYRWAEEESDWIVDGGGITLQINGLTLSTGLEVIVRVFTDHKFDGKGAGFHTGEVEDNKVRIRLNIRNMTAGQTKEWTLDDALSSIDQTYNIYCHFFGRGYAHDQASSCEIDFGHNKGRHSELTLYVVPLTQENTDGKVEESKQPTLRYL